MRLATSLTVINDALLEMAVISAAVADAYTSSDANVILTRSLLKSLGGDLLREHCWSHLQKTHTLETVDGTNNYALPADFASMLHSTEWNRSTDMPLTGPTGPEGWQTLQSGNVATSASYFFRVQGNRLYLYPTPSAAETIAFEYLSAYWVQPTGQSAPTTETPTASTDTIWFDSHLLSRGLKVKFREAKRMDATAERNEYERALAAATGRDGAQPVIDLAVGARGDRLPRLPETGWG